MERVEYCRGTLHSIEGDEDYGDSIVEVFRKNSRAKAVIHLLTDNHNFGHTSTRFLLKAEGKEIRLHFKRVSKTSTDLRHITRAEGTLSSYTIQYDNIDLEIAMKASENIDTEVRIVYPNIRFLSRFRADAEKAYKAHGKYPDDVFIRSQSVILYEDDYTSVHLSPFFSEGYNERGHILSVGNEVRIVRKGYIPEQSAFLDADDITEDLRHIFSFLEGERVDFSLRQVSYHSTDEHITHSTEYMCAPHDQRGGSLIAYDKDLCIRIIVRYLTLLRTLDQERRHALHVFMHRFLTADAAPDITITVAMIHTALQLLISFTDSTKVRVDTGKKATTVLKFFGIENTEDNVNSIVKFNDVRNRLFKSPIRSEDVLDTHETHLLTTKMRQFITHGFARLLGLSENETAHFEYIVGVLYR